MAKSPLRPKIEFDGQRYIDEPVRVKARLPSPVELAVGAAFGTIPRVKKPVTVGHERVHLRWMTSDGKGGLKPREKRHGK